MAIAHRSGGSVNAPQKIKGVVESVDGDNVKVYYKDGWGHDQHDTFKKSEIVGVMPSPASSPATSPAKPAAPSKEMREKAAAAGRVLGADSGKGVRELEADLRGLEESGRAASGPGRRKADALRDLIAYKRAVGAARVSEADKAEARRLAAEDAVETAVDEVLAQEDALPSQRFYARRASFDTPWLAEDGGENGFGLTDTSRGYKVTDLRSDRPYLQKNQAANGAFVDSGNAGGSRLDQRSVAAAHSSLERITNSLRNSAPKVKGMADSLLGVLDGMKSGKPVFDGGKPLTAKNFVTSMQALGFKRGDGAKSAYYAVEGENTTRASDHSATAELFVQDGTDNNLSVVIRRPGDKKKFIAADGVNAIEAVFPRADLEAHPEKLPQIVRDMGEFIATGEYHDTAGALAYNFSGGAEYQAKARDRIYGDALARGDMDTAQRMVREAAARAMPDTKVVGEDGLPKVVYHATPEKFTAFDKDKIFSTNSATFMEGFYFSDKRPNTPWNVMPVFLNAANPLVLDLDKASFDTIGAQEIGDAIVRTGSYHPDLNDYLIRNGMVEPDENGDYEDSIREWYVSIGTPDSMIVQNTQYGSHKDEYVVLEPNQIKSADPVTYDDAGNVIPLSQRFNPQNDDIRFDTPGIYTGSAADYANRSRQGGVDDGPSLKKIGTGEGSQVYGWGLYGSTVRGVAEGYAGIGETLYRNKNTGEIRSLEFGPKYKPMAMGDYDYYSGNVTPEAAKKGWERISGQEYLYEQTFFTDRAPGDESHLLKWYEPVTDEQMGWISRQAKLEKLENLDYLEGFLDRHPGATAHNIYSRLCDALGSPQAASEFLVRAGIDGVKYPVDSYGKAVKDGDKAGWNYVAFSDEHIRVDHKWTDGVLQFDTPELGDANARLEEVSSRFDDELQRQIDGTLPGGHVYQLGRPGAVLRSTGVPDLPIQLSAARLAEKSSDANHPFEIADAKGLVKALQSPVAVFAYGDRAKAQNIIVEMSSNGKNFLVGLSLNPEVGGRVLNVNSIRNVFPKDTAEWLHWIEQGKLLYADKQKVQDLIGQRRINLADVAYLDLNRVNSILDSFVNPQAENSQSAANARVTPAEDAAYMDAVRRGDTETAARMVREAAKRKGYKTAVFHGTPSGGFSVFKALPAYVTEIKEYADRYQSPSASSIRFGKQITQPETKSLFLDPRRMFDTRRKAVRDRFFDEYAQGGEEWAPVSGMNISLSRRGLPDWTEAESIADYIRAKHLPYDSIVVDEGGYPDLNGNVQDRGISYAVLKGSKLKSADPVTYDDAENVIPLSQRFNRENDDIRFDTPGIYTGSAADYANRSRQGGVDDGPSLKKIGTGEGSQVYGWGLYGSTVRGVAEGYAGFGGDNDRLLIDGRAVTDNEWREISGSSNVKMSQLANDIARNPRNLHIPGQLLLFKLKYGSRVFEWVKENADRISAESHGGNIYEQTFFTNRAPGDESHLLKWYEPVSEEQLGWIADAIEATDDSSWKQSHDAKGAAKSLREWNGVTGGDLYNTLAGELRSPQAASEFLARAGIDGVKYPVDSYGKAVKDGDKAGWNYVAFSDEHIRVDHKWTDGVLQFDTPELAAESHARSALADIAAGKPYGILHNPKYGEIRYPLGKSGAGGMGFLHIIEHRMNGGASLDEAINTAIRVGEAAEIGKETMARMNTRHFDYNGTRAIVAIDEMENPIITGYEIDADETAAAHRRAAELAPHPHVSSEEVIEHLRGILAQRGGEVKGASGKTGETPFDTPELDPGRRAEEANTYAKRYYARHRALGALNKPKPEGVMDAAEGRWQRFRRAVQDKNLVIREVEERLGVTDKRLSVYYAKDREFGLNEHQLYMLQKRRVEPIFDALAKSGVSQEAFDLYLIARHAPYRNALVRGRNGRENGSGMSDADSDAVLGKFRALGLEEDLSRIAEMVYAMNDEALQRLVDSGRMKQEEADGFRAAQADYVPLRTDMEDADRDVFNSSTSGWKKHEFHAALGRGSLADSPLAWSIVQAERAVKASNANAVRRAAAALVRRAKREGRPIGEIIPARRVQKRWALDIGGEVWTADALQDRPDIIFFKENGDLKAIRVDSGKNALGLTFAKAVTDKDLARFGEWFEWVPKMTRAMAAMRTQYVPTFILRNLKADTLEVLLNAWGERGLGGAASFGRRLLANEWRNRRDVRDYFRTGEARGWMREFVENGGLTGGGMAAEGFSEAARRIRKTLKTARGGAARSLAAAVPEAISLLNACAEYNTRLGVYSALRQEGWTVEDAVSYARDATVNFNRRGYLTPYLNAAYMFSNASIQGMGRAFKTMGAERGRQAIAGMFLLGVIQALLDWWLGSDDERERDGLPNARNLTEHDKQTSIGVPLPGGLRLKTQARNPWALPMYAGRKTAELAVGWTTPKDAAKDMASALGGFATEPVGGNGFDSISQTWQTFAPTLADPLVQWMTGRNFKGDARLRKKFNDYLPDSWNGRRNTAAPYKWIAKGLNAVSGGGEFRQGAFDTSPENWQLLAETALGGALTDLDRAAAALADAWDAARGAKPDQVLRDVPFVRDTLTNMPDVSRRYYDRLREYEADAAEYNGARTAAERLEYAARHPWVADGRAKALKREVDDLGKQEQGLEKQGGEWAPAERSPAEQLDFRRRRLRKMAEFVGIMEARPSGTVPEETERGIRAKALDDDYRRERRKFLDAAAEYDKAAGDPKIEGTAKSAILESMRASYPFLKDDVRSQIEDRIRDINREKADIQRWRRQGAADGDGDVREAEAAVETAKSAIIELVRGNR